MAADSVQENLEKLVDSLRQNRCRTPELADVAAVTEVLIGTLRNHCSNLDDTIYKEFHYLAAYIAEARSEIAELKPDDINSEKIPRAGKELEAIVQHTEEATGTIMDAAEEIMSADISDLDAYQASTTDACMRIFEACSFQDITGQRINKVVRTLTFIEERLNRLLVVWGSNVPENTENKEADNLERSDGGEAPLSGPALAGEGIDQSEVDNLIDGAVTDTKAAATPAAVADAGQEAEPDDSQDTASDADELAAADPADADFDAVSVADAPGDDAPGDDAPGDDAPESVDVPVSEDTDDSDVDPAVVADSNKKSSQADIDALFD